MIVSIRGLFDFRMQGVVAAASLIALGALVAFSTGCGETQTKRSERPHLQQLAYAYNGYIMSHNYQPPPGEVVFKQWVKKLPEEKLKQWVITDTEAIFVSPRDNEPYVIEYGTPKGGAMSHRLVVYEKTGVDGKRYGAYEDGTVMELDEAEFQKLKGK